jgi:hypothetical protein
MRQGGATAGLLSYALRTGLARLHRRGVQCRRGTLAVITVPESAIDPLRKHEARWVPSLGQRQAPKPFAFQRNALHGSVAGQRNVRRITDNLSVLVQSGQTPEDCQSYYNATSYRSVPGTCRSENMSPAAGLLRQHVHKRGSETAIRTSTIRISTNCQLSRLLKQFKL